MKKVNILIAVLCMIAIGCTKSPVKNSETVSAPVTMQRYIGRFMEDVSICKSFGDKLLIQKEQEESFDVYSLDMDKAALYFEYTIISQDKLLYCKQLDANRSLQVKQLGNSEENNILVLEGKVKKNIASKVAYSGTALVATSPSQKYVVYCMADDVLNRYGLQLYNIQTDKTLQLIDTVNEELLNDMTWNISWSPDEAYVIVSNSLVFDSESGRLLKEIKAQNVFWSAYGNKLAYIKPQRGLGKSISVLDLESAETEEVFIADGREYLPGYVVWNENTTKLAFITAAADSEEAGKDINFCTGIYSLDLAAKKAVRVDNALQLTQEQTAGIEAMRYNSSGSILAFAIAGCSGSDLHIYDFTTGQWKFFINTEYLHYEDNEDYACSAENNLYFVQGQEIIELDENMTVRTVYTSAEIIDDIYISKDGNTMIIIEKSRNGMVLRQLKNFAAKSI